MTLDFLLSGYFDLWIMATPPPDFFVRAVWDDIKSGGDASSRGFSSLFESQVSQSPIMSRLWSSMWSYIVTCFEFSDLMFRKPIFNSLKCFVLSDTDTVLME